MFTAYSVKFRDRGTKATVFHNFYLTNEEDKNPQASVWQKFLYRVQMDRLNEFITNLNNDIKLSKSKPKIIKVSSNIIKKTKKTEIKIPYINDINKVPNEILEAILPLEYHSLINNRKLLLVALCSLATLTNQYQICSFDRIICEACELNIPGQRQHMECGGCLHVREECSYCL